MSKIIGEAKNLRTKNSKHFMREDGLIEAVLYFHDIHFEDEAGEMRGIQTDLLDETELAGYAGPIPFKRAGRIKRIRKEAQDIKAGKIPAGPGWLRPVRVTYDADIPKRIRNGYTIGSGQQKLSFIPIGAADINAERDPERRNVVIYRDTWPSADLILEATEQGIKETIILKDPAAPVTFSFEVGGDLGGSDLRILPAWLQDVDGFKRDVSQRIREDGGKKYIDLVADVSGLAYPIEVDPTVTINSFTADNYTDSANPNQVWQANSIARIGYEVGVGTQYRYFFKPNLTSIPAGAIVSDAKLYAYGYGYGGVDANTTWYSGYAAADWSPSALTHNNQPGVGPSQVVNAGQLTQYWPLQITNAIQAIISGSVPNYGVVIWGYQNQLDINTMDNTSNKPYITVTYNAPPTAPVLTVPNGGETWNAQHTVTWTAATDSDTAQASLKYHIQISTDNGASWSDVVGLTPVGATSYTYDFTPVPASTQAKVRIRAWDGAIYGPWDESNAVFTILHNQAPSAPINTSPGGASSSSPEIVTTLTPTLSWTFSDPNAGNTQGWYQVQIFDAVGTSVHDIGQVSGAAGSFIVPAAKLAWNTKYYWRVRTWDNSGAAGAYAADEWIQTNQGPTTNITTPAGTTSGAPTIFNDTLVPSFAWTYSDPEGQVQKAVQIIILDGVTQVWDSGSIATAGTTYQIPASANLVYDKVYNAKIRGQDNVGSWGAYSSLKYFKLNRSPNAPTNLSPGNTNANTPEIVLDNLQPTLAWTFSDPDPSATQQGFIIEIYDATAGSLLHTQTVASATKSYAVPAGVLISGKKYYWRVKARDQHAQYGPFSASEYLYTNASPNTPTNPAPAGGSAASPAIIDADLTPRLQWTFGDPNAGDLQAAFQFRLYTEAGTLLLDTGEVAGAANFYDIPNVNKLAYGSIYQWDVRVKDSYGAWSNYTSRGWIKPIVAPPTGLTATADNFGAQIIIDWTDSLAEGLQGYNVFRSDTQAGAYSQINASLVTVSNFADANVITGQTYWYKVQAYVNDQQISDLSPAVSAAAVFSAWFIGSYKFDGPTSFNVKKNRIQNKRQALGKKKSVIQDKGFGGDDIDLELYLIDDQYGSGKSKYDALLAELSKTIPLSIRDPFGRTWKIAPGDFDERQLGTGKLEYAVKFSLTEVN